MTLTATFSHSFIAHLRLLYSAALRRMASGKYSRHGINGYTDYAGPAYAGAVTSIEALLNEITLGHAAKSSLADSPLWTLDAEWVDRLPILQKLVIVPHLLFGRTSERDSQPYQDMRLLVKVRNDFVHYRLRDSAPPCIAVLEQRGIALPSLPSGADYVWVHKVSTSEGIRWANNTACAVARTLVTFIPDAHRGIMMAFLADNFVEIPDSVAREVLQNAGLDPDAAGP